MRVCGKKRELITKLLILLKPGRLELILNGADSALPEGGVLGIN